MSFLIHFLRATICVYKIKKHVLCQLRVVINVVAFSVFELWGMTGAIQGKDI